MKCPFFAKIVNKYNPSNAFYALITRLYLLPNDFIPTAELYLIDLDSTDFRNLFNSVGDFPDYKTRMYSLLLRDHKLISLDDKIKCCYYY